MTSVATCARVAHLATAWQAWRRLEAVAALGIAFAGPSSLSVDALVGHYLSGTFWGAAALFVGVFGAVMPLIQRRAIPTQQTAAAQ